MSIPYERIIQWVAGPFAVAIGVLATKLVANLNWLGQLGLQKSAVAHGIVVAVTFVVSAGVTYLSHAKWMSNLPKWWEKNIGTVPVTGGTVTKTVTTDTADKLRAQLRNAGINPEA